MIYVKEIEIKTCQNFNVVKGGSKKNEIIISM